MNDKIRKLQEEIEKEERKIKNCKHIFGKSFYNPEKVKEPYGYKFEAHGSDFYTEPQGYRDVDKPRWTRVCSECGFEQYAYDQKPIVSGYEPNFK